MQTHLSLVLPKVALLLPLSLNQPLNLNGAVTIGDVVVDLVDGPEDEAVRDNRERYIRKWVSTLPPRQQEVVWKFFWDELSLSEIARQCGISPAGVHSAIQKAMANGRRTIDRAAIL